jgi:hypothetical protein
MQKIFDYFIEQLNNNTDGLVYKGNFLFRFETDRLSVYEPVEGKLVNEEVKYRPVALTTSEDVPFVENNNRVDWLLEVGMLVPINGDAYDATTDLDYANIQSVCRAMNGSSITVEGTKYSVKVSPYPKYRGWTFLGETAQYAILSVTFNLTETTSGNFTQDWTISVDSKVLDYVNASFTTSKRFYTANDKSDDSNDYNKPIGRSIVLEVTFNYDNETQLLAEVMGSSALKQEHTVVLTFGETSYTYKMVVESAPMALSPGNVMQLTVRMVEV